MNKVNVNSVIDSGKFNAFFLSVFIFGIFATFFDGYDMAVYGVTLTLLMQDLGLDATQTGLLASAATFGMIFGAIICGMLADKFGRKKVMVMGISFYSVFTGLCGVVENIQVFAVFRFLGGFGMAAVIPLATAVLSEYSPKSKRNFLVTCTSFGSGFGQTICTLLGVLLLSFTTWHTMYLFSFLPIVVALLIYFFYPESMIFYIKRGEQKTIAKLLQKANPEFSPTPSDEYVINSFDKTKGTLWNLFQNGLARNTILIWIMFFCNMYMAFGIMTWMPKLMTMMGYSFTSGLVFTLVYSCGGLVGALAAGLLADKLGLKKVMTIIYIASAICVLLTTIKMDQNVFVVLIFVMGMFLNVPNLLTFAFTAQSYPLSMRGTGLGWGSGIGRIGSVLAPILIGILITAGIPVNITFGTIAIPAAIGAVCITLTKKIEDTEHFKAALQ